MKHYKKVILIGDSIIDKYIFVKYSKYLEDVDVYKIVNIDNKPEVYQPGGAANVCKILLDNKIFVNFLTFGKFRDFSLILKNIDILNLIINEIDYDLPVKIRLVDIDIKKKLIRIDREFKSPKIKINYEFLIKKLNEIISKDNKIKYCLISDYNKIVLNDNIIKEIIKVCNKNNLKVIIDPKKDDLSLYKGSYILTPNESEFEKLFNQKIDDLNYDFIKTILDKNKIENLIITRSEKPVILINTNIIKEFQITENVNKIDVSGAGDVFISYLTISLINGHNLDTSIEIAIKKSSKSIENLGIGLNKIF